MATYTNIEQLNRPPRYINATKLQKVVFEASWCNEVDCQQTLRLLDETPTEDVVPRSEVERLEQKLKDQDFTNTILRANAHSPVIERAKQEVAREIFEEIDKILETQEKYLYCNPSLAYVYELIAEIEKKYIGE